MTVSSTARALRVPLLGMVVVAALAARPVASDEIAIFAGGCFWGVESVFEHVRGVQSAVSGFAVPVAASVSPQRRVAPGASSVEAVRVVYDPAQISYQQLLEVFFQVAHDPTQIDRQGPDVGPEYRSIVFVQDDEQRRLVLDYVDRLEAAHTWPEPIVTQVARLQSFTVAPPEHQDYAERHPREAYVVINDAPKLRALQARYPALYRSMTP